MGLIYYNNNPYLHNVEKFSLKPLCLIKIPKAPVLADWRLVVFSIILSN